MEINVANQAFVYVMSFVLGALLGVVYDFFRVIRLILKSKFWVFVEDYIFCVFGAFIVYFFVFVINSGQIRLFVLTGAFFGFIIYYYTIGRLVYKFAKWLINLIFRIFKFLFGKIHYVILKIKKAIKDFKAKIQKKYAENKKNAKKKAKKVKKSVKKIKNNSKPLFKSDKIV